MLSTNVFITVLCFNYMINLTITLPQINVALIFIISVFHILCNRSSQDDCSEQRERNLLRRLTHVPTNRVKSEQQDGRLASSSRALRSRTPRNTQSRDLSDYRTGLCVASRPPCRPPSPRSIIWGASGGILCAMNWKVGGKPQKGWL